jgi:hypothetical protein
MHGQDGPGHDARRKDRYQPRATSASQRKTLRDVRGSRILKGEETSRPPGAGSDEIRKRARHQDCQSTRLGSTAECVCPCRRGDRMKLLLYLLASLHGTKPRFDAVRKLGRYRSKADIRFLTHHPTTSPRYFALPALPVVSRVEEY